jgi:hypothetical protein
MKKRITILAALMSLVLFGSAAANFKIMPIFQEVKVNRGGHTTFTLTLVNLNKTPLGFTIWTADLDAKEDGSPFIPTDSMNYQRGCGNWIKIDTTGFTLNPDEVRAITVKIQAPKNCEGSYFAFIYCDEKEPKTLTGTASGITPTLDIGLRMYCSLFVTVPSAKNSADIEPDTLYLYPGKATGAQLGASTSDNAAWRVEVPVKNTGNMVTVVKGTATIYDEAKRLVGRADLISGRGYVLPQHRRNFIAQGNKVLANGSYMIMAHLETKERKTMGGIFTYTVLDGKVFYGSGSEEIKSLVKASTPKFELQKQFLEFNATPGAKRNSGTTVRNLTDEYLPLKAVPLNVLSDDQGNVTIVEGSGNSDLPSCRSWVTVVPDTFTLAPKGSTSLKITMTMPETIAGEYYTAVLLKSQNDNSDLPTSFLLPNSIFISAASSRNVKKSCEIVHYKNTEQGIGGCLFELAVKNTGNVHCYISGQLSLENSRGELMGERVEFGSDNFYMLPSSTFRTLVPDKTYLPPGLYKAYVSVEYDAKTKPLMQELDVTVK